MSTTETVRRRRPVARPRNLPQDGDVIDKPIRAAIAALRRLADEEQTARRTLRQLREQGLPAAQRLDREERAGWITAGRKLASEPPAAEHETKAKAEIEERERDYAALELAVDAALGELRRVLTERGPGWAAHIAEEIGGARREGREHLAALEETVARLHRLRRIAAWAGDWDAGGVWHAAEMQDGSIKTFTEGAPAVEIAQAAAGRLPLARFVEVIRGWCGLEPDVEESEPEKDDESAEVAG